MEAPAQLHQEGEENNLKVEAEEEEVGLLRRQSTTRRHGVDGRGIFGNASVSTNGSSGSNNGAIANEKPEAEQELVGEVMDRKNEVQERGPEAETIDSFEEEGPDKELKDENDGVEQEPAPEPDEVDDNENDGGENGTADVAVLAPRAKTEFDNHNGVEGKGLTWTNIFRFEDERG